MPPCRAGEVCREVFAMLSMLYSLELRITLRPILWGPPGVPLKFAAPLPANGGGTAKLGGIVGRGAWCPGWFGRFWSIFVSSMLELVVKTKISNETLRFGNWLDICLSSYITQLYMLLHWKHQYKTFSKCIKCTSNKLKWFLCVVVYLIVYTDVVLVTFLNVLWMMVLDFIWLIQYESLDFKWVLFVRLGTPQLEVQSWDQPSGWNSSFPDWPKQRKKTERR